jgi:hypothetical protein
LILEDTEIYKKMFLRAKKKWPIFWHLGSCVIVQRVRTWWLVGLPQATARPQKIGQNKA